MRNITNNAFDVQGSFRDTVVHHCIKLGCTERTCIGYINEMYERIISSVETSSRQFLKRRRKKTNTK